MHKEWKKDREWKSPVCDSVERTSSIKRSDADRGLERVGRLVQHVCDGVYIAWGGLQYITILST